MVGFGSSAKDRKEKDDCLREKGGGRREKGEGRSQSSFIDQLVIYSDRRNSENSMRAQKSTVSLTHFP